ncbi:hypothetical protein Tco_1198642 [Tanacetum coccineum]
MKSNCSNWGSDTSGRGVSIRGEGQLKRILDVTQNLVLMVEEKHYKSAVEGSIPVFVKFVSRMDTAEEIDDLFVGDAEQSKIIKIVVGTSAGAILLLISV